MLNKEFDSPKAVENNRKIKKRKNKKNQEAAKFFSQENKKTKEEPIQIFFPSRNCHTRTKERNDDRMCRFLTAPI